MKAKYINPFLKASLNLFRDFLGMDVTEGKPYLIKDPTDLNEVSGIIGLAGETVGAVVISFSKQTAVKIVSKLLGENQMGLNNDVLDGVGELINIIAGNAKKDLLDFRISISIPGVIVGKNSSIRWPKGIPVVTIPFKSDLGDFTVNVSLKDLA